MSGVRGFLSGVLGLVTLQVIVANPNAYDRLGGAATLAGEAAHWWLSPTVAAIPDRSSSGTATNMAAVTSTGSSLPVAGAEGASSSTMPGLVASVVDVALSQLGAPYVFDTQGQINSAGQRTFDCSGLVSWVYKQAANIDLVPSSFVQAQSGSAVPANPASIRAGDLIFTRDSEGRVNGHVGIALDGNTWVTAPHTGAVVHTSPIPWADVTSNQLAGGAGVRRILQ
jgi:cell wall-associated NlpC family hydrolase